jgi:hypothetical protein
MISTPCMTCGGNYDMTHWRSAHRSRQEISRDKTVSVVISIQYKCDKSGIVRKGNYSPTNIVLEKKNLHIRISWQQCKQLRHSFVFLYYNSKTALSTQASAVQTNSKWPSIYNKNVLFPRSHVSRKEEENHRNRHPVL